MYKNIEVVIKNYSGLSTETKPTSSGGSAIPNGSRWREVDTGNTYHYDISTDKWYQTGSTPKTLTFGDAVQDITTADVLNDILSEIRIMNVHLSLLTDSIIFKEDLES